MTAPLLKTVTLGCKVNQYETEYLREGLLGVGYQDADRDQTADLCIVNTCTVTAEGDSKSRQTVRQLARRNPGTKIVVMGCYATRAPEELERGGPVLVRRREFAIQFDGTLVCGQGVGVATQHFGQDMPAVRVEHRVMRVELDQVVPSGQGLVAKSMTYNEIRNDDVMRKGNFITAWLAGFVMGLSARSVDCGNRLSACIDKTSPDQRVVMVDKKANEEPQRWGGDHSFAIFIYAAFVHPCFEGEIPLK